MNKPAAFLATYSDWKLIRTRQCVQLVFELPLHDADKAYNALGGMPNSGAEVWCGISRIDPNKIGAGPPKEEDRATPSDHPPPNSRKPVAPEKRLTVRAAILSNDPLFQRYLRIIGNVVENDASAAAYIREFCQVVSRKDILPGTKAAIRLDSLESAFIGWRDADKFVEAS